MLGGVLSLSKCPTTQDVESKTKQGSANDQFLNSEHVWFFSQSERRKRGRFLEGDQQAEKKRPTRVTRGKQILGRSCIKNIIGGEVSCMPSRTDVAGNTNESRKSLFWRFLEILLGDSCVVSWSLAPDESPCLVSRSWLTMLVAGVCARQLVFSSLECKEK